MNQPEDQPSANYVTCRCQHCDKGIEFDASHAGDLAACPHSGLETKLFIPPTKISPPTPPSPPNNPTPKHVNEEIKRSVNPLGVAALVLGIIACAFCWIPVLGFFVFPLALIGIVCAGLGLIMSRKNKNVDATFPIGGGIVCVLAILIALVVTGTFASLTGLANAKHQREVREQERQRKAQELQWTSRQGDITVKVSDVVHGFTTGESTTERGLIVKTSNFLLITVDVYNSSTTRIFDFATFRQDANLTDDKGNTYSKLEMYAGRSLNTTLDGTDGWLTPNFGLPNFSIGYPKFSPNSCRIQPKTGWSDILGFNVPDSTGKVLYLELSAENFGGTGKIKFEIPATTIKNW